ncbi:MAG: hypothetical protein U1F57_11640 [bacterium]
MSFRINGALVNNPEAAAALQAVSQNPQAYGILPASLQRNGNDVYFTADQVLQILNPNEPQRNVINSLDRLVRATQHDAPLSSSQFTNLAREFQSQFSQLLAQRNVRIDNGLFGIGAAQVPNVPSTGTSGNIWSWPEIRRALERR